jgi:hypothetical protein
MHYTREELAALPDWHPIGMTGFGLLFVRQPLHYVFHADVTGEDVHFWFENPQLDIRYAKQVRVGHMKSITLDDNHWLQMSPSDRTVDGDRRKDAIRDVQPVSTERNTRPAVDHHPSAGNEHLSHAGNWTSADG